MHSPRRPTGFYSIIDVDSLNGNVRTAAQKILDCGVQWIQLRAKNHSARDMAHHAETLLELCRGYNAALIINDRADICMAVGAHGVHLGQDDICVKDARKLLGKDAIIGTSTHNLQQAVSAEQQGHADYIGVGPIFSTTSKLKPDPTIGIETLREICSKVSIPVVAIGGITLDQCQTIRECGASAVAMISAVLRTDSVERNANLAVELCR